VQCVTLIYLRFQEKIRNSYIAYAGSTNTTNTTEKDIV